MRLRSVILIVLTLIIGFVLGMLTSAQIRYQKLKPMRVYFSEERFREGFYNIIQPDEQQKATIEEVLDKYAKINHDLQNTFRKELDANMKAFSKELDSKLTNEQLTRLREWDEKRQEMIEQGRKAFENDSTGRMRRGHNPRLQGRPGYEHQRLDSVGAPPDSIIF
ncbi:MAG TPA: hypothetical protein VHO50_02470 [Bacteroidales bacterium]|nr:hypothetical protein [Bacteroidales bacterium]